MRFFSEALERLPEYKAVASAVGAPRLPMAVTGLSTVHKAHMISALCEKFGKPAFVVAADEQDAARLSEDLASFLGGGVFLLPARDFTLRPMESVSREFEHDRLRVFGAMLRGECRAVVACADAAAQLTMPPEEYRRRSVKLASGETFPIEKTEAALLSAGYVRADQVEGMGQFSRRGGILDFFPTYLPSPVRVEFWGDEPDTLSLFEPGTQRRTAPLREALITPAVEVHFESDEVLAGRLAKLRERLSRGKGAQKLILSIEDDLTRLKDGLPPLGTDRYLPLCYGRDAAAFDYAVGSLLFVSEPSRARERIKNTLWQHNEDVAALLEEGLLTRELTRFYLEWPEICSLFEKRGAVYLEAFSHAGYDTPLREAVAVTARQLSVWSGGLDMLLEDLKPYLERGGRAVVMAGSEKVCAPLARDLCGAGISAAAPETAESLGQPPAGGVFVLPGQFSAGFEYPGLGLMVLSRGQGAARFVKRRGGAKKRPGERIRSLAEITPGDYVVHAAHGIGVYDGIRKLDVQGIVKDYIKIRYAGSDTLYVPVTQLDLVSKYIGPREDGAVRLSKMGGAEWQKQKTRVRAAVRDMAKELIALYAARQRVKGVAFPEDNDWQRDFEERFEYDETDDQLRCTAEIKQDMERSCPMERLLCGDVGFGKTEVALRAAFKCVMGGKQCALLVPTTILAWQHYQTMLRRFEGFPIRLELLSRFRTPKQQEEILRRLTRGEIDMIVGTHRLVQKDVRFRALGLLVVDEEQRFGVAQKERLKETFKNVDVLTLSATPIPRTLNMALSGIRDMSVLEEAPQDRHPVQTYVLEYDPGVIADAVKKELRRGGQVYYLHNRVESIQGCAERLHKLVPGARIGIAHGKMSEEELSLVWENLLNGEIDVLVCTTIIETGVDVPNCNTLIIEDADRMGLSQLHQIRGRVGRSSRRAYAFFTFRRGKVLSEISTKRLSAIREFTEFGSGFQIALRDLEIRGAGNILGAQQHGHMEAVGYDMYLKLLNEAVLEEQGKKPEADAECMVDIQVSAHIPESYIPNEPQRLEIYRRIAGIRSQEDVSDVVDELVDRFSDPPQAVKSLIDVALVRNTAAALGIHEITQRGDVVMLFPQRLDMTAVSFLVSRLRRRVMVNAGQKPYISVKLGPGQAPVDALREAIGLLREAAREDAPEKQTAGADTCRTPDSVL